MKCSHVVLRFLPCPCHKLGISVRSLVPIRLAKVMDTLDRVALLGVAFSLLDSNREDYPARNGIPQNQRKLH
jgi:hypothetical protein